MQFTPRNYLEELGFKYRPTKMAHDYLRHYWSHLRDIRESVTKVCEIGVQSDRSVRMWEEFFPNATIYGVDIDPSCKSFESGRVKIRIGDQSDPRFLSELVGEAGSFDVIIDDGSHVPAHQITTFNYLFPCLSSHGVYVVEDTGGCVGDEDLSAINALKTLIDNVYYWPKGLPGSQWSTLSSLPEGASWLDRNVVGVAFYRWIAFVHRGRNAEDNPFLAT